jgi:hypothetical protein
VAPDPNRPHLHRKPLTQDKVNRLKDVVEPSTSTSQENPSVKVEQEKSNSNARAFGLDLENMEVKKKLDKRTDMKMTTVRSLAVVFL